jgi:hypothetical protein
MTEKNTQRGKIMTYPAYNPYLYQQNYQQPQQYQSQATPPGFSCRPVTSKEEATAVQVDFFGPGTVMPDLAHGIIYLKRFNSQTGACDIFEFTASEPKAQGTIQYATQADIEALRVEIEKLKEKRSKNIDSNE